MFSKNQIRKAELAYPNATKCYTSKNVAVWGIDSLSNPAVNYQVRLEWSKEKIEDIECRVVLCRCNKVTSLAGGYTPCLGGVNKVCYHSLAVLKAAAKRAGKKIVFFNSFKKCLNYSNLGGEIIKIKARPDDKLYIFAVVKQ